MDAKPLQEENEMNTTPQDDIKAPDPKEQHDDLDPDPNNPTEVYIPPSKPLERNSVELDSIHRRLNFFSSSQWSNYESCPKASTIQTRQHRVNTPRPFHSCPVLHSDGDEYRTLPEFPKGRTVTSIIPEHSSSGSIGPRPGSSGVSSMGLKKSSGTSKPDQSMSHRAPTLVPHDQPSLEYFFDYLRQKGSRSEKSNSKTHQNPFYTDHNNFYGNGSMVEALKDKERDFQETELLIENMLADVLPPTISSGTPATWLADLQKILDHPEEDYHRCIRTATPSSSSSNSRVPTGSGVKNKRFLHPLRIRAIAHPIQLRRVVSATNSTSRSRPTSSSSSSQGQLVTLPKATTESLPSLATVSLLPKNKEFINVKSRYLLTRPNKMRKLLSLPSIKQGGGKGRGLGGGEKVGKSKGQRSKGREKRGSLNSKVKLLNLCSGDHLKLKGSSKVKGKAKTNRKPSKGVKTKKKSKVIKKGSIGSSTAPRSKVKQKRRKVVKVPKKVIPPKKVVLQGLGFEFVKEKKSKSRPRSLPESVVHEKTHDDGHGQDHIIKKFDKYKNSIQKMLEKEASIKGQTKIDGSHQLPSARLVNLHRVPSKGFQTVIVKQQEVKSQEQPQLPKTIKVDNVVRKILNNLTPKKSPEPTSASATSTPNLTLVNNEPQAQMRPIPAPTGKSLQILNSTSTSTPKSKSNFSILKSTKLNSFPQFPPILKPNNNWTQFPGGSVQVGTGESHLNRNSSCLNSPVILRRGGYYPQVDFSSSSSSNHHHQIPRIIRSQMSSVLLAKGLSGGPRAHGQGQGVRNPLNNSRIHRGMGLF